MKLHGTGRRLRLTAGAAALLLCLTACGTGTGGDAEPAASPAPTAPSATSEAPAESEAPSAEPAPTPELSMAASAPVSVSIPAIDLDSELIQTGMRADRTLEVPPDAEGSPASWYDGSPTPGEPGASVLLGHVNSLSDDSGVFYSLDALQPGDEISVTREDGTTAVFEIYDSESFAKDEFPTRAVYFPVPGAELRLITCDNLDGSSEGFPNNLVVFAKLVETA